MKTYKHLLLATSLNPRHERLAVKAVQLAEDFSARLSLLHVFEGQGSGSDMSCAREALKRLGRQLVVPSFDQRLVVGDVAAVIHDVAKTLQVDAIILGRKLNDVTRVMLDTAPCDVIQVLL